MGFLEGDQTAAASTANDEQLAQARAAGHDQMRDHTIGQLIDRFDLVRALNRSLGSAKGVGCLPLVSVGAKWRS